MKGIVFVAVLGLFCAFVHAGTNAAGLAFLEENSKKEGVVTLPSGLQYKILRSGNGEFHPTADSSCTCHYHGTLTDGSVFDSSMDRGQPIDFAPNQVIRGWTEAMQLMVEGDKWELYIPSELAYGDRGSPPKIGGGDALVFIIEIIKIKGDKTPAVRCNPLTQEQCSDKEKAYIEKVKEKDRIGLQEELTRLARMAKGKMKPELANWIQKRQNILHQLVAVAPKEDL